MFLISYHERIITGDIHDLCFKWFNSIFNFNTKIIIIIYIYTYISFKAYKMSVFSLVSYN